MAVDERRCRFCSFTADDVNGRESHERAVHPVEMTEASSVANDASDNESEEA